MTASAARIAEVRAVLDAQARAEATGTRSPYLPPRPAGDPSIEGHLLSRGEAFALQHALPPTLVEVANLLAAGHDNAAIARRLGLTPAAVAQRLARLYRTLNLPQSALSPREVALGITDTYTSRTRMVVLLLRAGFPLDPAAALPDMISRSLAARVFNPNRLAALRALVEVNTARQADAALGLDEGTVAGRLASACDAASPPFTGKNRIPRLAVQAFMLGLLPPARSTTPAPAPAPAADQPATTTTTTTTTPEPPYHQLDPADLPAPTV